MTCKFKKGDIVVITRKFTGDKTLSWLPDMDKLIGIPGIVTTTWSNAWEADTAATGVRTYFEPAPVVSFAYRSSVLRPATEEEKQSFLLIHLVRKDESL